VLHAPGERRVLHWRHVILMLQRVGSRLAEALVQPVAGRSYVHVHAVEHALPGFLLVEAEMQEAAQEAPAL
jgi:hypothetical protein